MSEAKIDVVDLLREFAGPRYPDDICGKRCMGEAADEITRLRTAVEAQMQAKHAAEAEAKTMFEALQKANVEITRLRDRSISQAMAAYLRVCSSGGMPKHLHEQVQRSVDEAERLGYFDPSIPSKSTS